MFFHAATAVRFATIDQWFQFKALMGNTGIKDEKEFGKFAEGFLRFSSLFTKFDAPSSD
jgi:hypothetical protein